MADNDYVGQEEANAPAKKMIEKRGILVDQNSLSLSL